MDDKQIVDLYWERNEKAITETAAKYGGYCYSVADNTQYIVGNVTEIGEDYIKVDDSIMMKNPDDGIEFTVMANNMNIKRYIISGFLKKGQLVRITHTGTLCGNHTVVETATMLEEVMLAKNDIIFFE